MIQAPKRKTLNLSTKWSANMALENVLESIAASLAAIATVMQTQSQASAVLGAPEAPAEKKTRAKKTEEAVAVVATPNASQVVTPVTEVVANPVQTTPAASTASSQKPWAEVLAKVVEVNKSELPTAGRKGVEGILAHFFGADAPGKKVPALEGLNKHNEVFAYAASLLAPAAPADDDLGL